MFRAARLKRFTACVVVATGTVTVLGETSAHATVAPLKLAVYQGTMSDWLKSVGGGSITTAAINTVAANLAQADVLVVTNTFKHAYGGAEWPNASGCEDNVGDGTGGTINERTAAMEPVLAKVKALHPSIQIFGYVAGPTDAPDNTGTHPGTALCGNNVNNYYPDTDFDGDGNYTTKFGTCPGGTCSNFILWANQWATTMPLKNYIDGIFIDYVTSVQMTPTIRDSEYSYVKNVLHLKVMANSTVPGAPAPGVTSTFGYSGSTTNYEFAADSTYLDNSDYVMVEGYKWAGNVQPAGCPASGVGCAPLDATHTYTVATDMSTPTAGVDGVRSSLATAHSGVQPRLAALVTEPYERPAGGAFGTTHVAFTSLSCSFADFTSAKAALTGATSAVTGDAISYEFSDYNSYHEAPSYPISYCS